MDLLFNKISYNRYNRLTIIFFTGKELKMSKQKMSILDFKKFKEEGKKFSFVTAYDYTMASIIDNSETEVILVGDSLGMIMLG